VHIARKRRVKAIQLDTTLQNKGAMKLYTSMGFVEVNRKHFKVGNKNYIGVTMRLLLK